ncbi:E3 ubiquitin-protein ligase RHF2A [Cajanus cajan]|uniref:RING-type E3 ubiquitin transferase n=1 Tax=Cajanus cajan TaxID=3821 RepID=A0A151SQD2_CAJCA|nr:E3 ubiquitin-protein ligase RHF2A [Cajanus cajan]XP_020228833.1 E3 ubiquitin-protein ligase RHF2A [Cajanus cajan]KYP56978.1 E3 ubiquitin-protein ligase At3g02290 family [Cajanus cajan]
MEGKTESHISSAAAFVEGGVQDLCDDACSICLEEFSKSDPSTVTTCKHEFHLQCILEWCQRSSQCPMCWQPISLKDPSSQELFEAVEQERSLRVTTSRNASIFHQLAFDDYELQHLRMSVNDPDFEDRVIQHIATTAAMRRAAQLGQREGQRTRSAHGHPHFSMFSTQPIALSLGHDSVAGENEPTAIPNRSASTLITSDGDEPSQQILHVQTQSPSSAFGSTVMTTNHQGVYFNDRGSTDHSSPTNQDREGPSEFQSFSDSLRSRFSCLSVRYKESISKGARGWRERLFSRSSSMSAVGSKTRRVVNTGIDSVSGLLESPETSENNRVMGTSLSNHMEGRDMGGVSYQNNVEATRENSSHDNNTPPACSAISNLN